MKHARWIDTLLVLSVFGCGGSAPLLFPDDDASAPPAHAPDQGDGAPDTAAEGEAAVPEAAIEEPAPPPADPFHAGDHWIGTYTCAQGATHLDLGIAATHGDAVDDAVFAFDDGFTTGSFHVSGTFDPATAEADFDAGAWIDRPSGWQTVGMRGHVDLGTMVYSGTIAGAGCGAFSVKR